MLMSYKYKNVSDQDIDLVGHGTVKAGAEITTLTPVTNANFELVGQDDQHTQGVVGTEAPQPNAVINATPVVSPVGDQPQGGTKA